MSSLGIRTSKLGRKRDQRGALIRSLARSVILEGSITTTKTKAKTVLPLVEKLATKAKQNNLHSRRQIISILGDVESAEVLINRMNGVERTSGHFRVIKDDLPRKGDGAPMATLSFVDDKKTSPPASKPKKDIQEAKETTSNTIKTSNDSAEDTE